MTPKELRDKRAKLVSDARQLLDSATDGKLTTEQDAKYAAIMADVKAIKDQVERMEALDAEERSVVPESQRPTVKADVPTPTNREERVRQAVSAPEYRAAWGRYIRSTQGREFLTSDEKRALQVGVDTEGGYLAPDEYERTLIQALVTPVVMRQPGMATVIGSVSGDKTVPVESSTGTAYWTTEEALATESDVAFGKVELHAYKLATIIKVSEELVADSVFPLEAYLVKEFARRIGKAEDTAFMTGNGINRPKGVSVTSTLGVTAAAVAAVTCDELISLKFALGRMYRSSAKWVMADSTIQAISKLKDGNGQYMWQPGLVANIPDQLLSRPVITSDDMPTMATGVKSILFGDFSYYWICDRAGIVFQTLKERYAEYGQIAYRAYLRTDGDLTLATAVYHLIQA